MNGRGSADWNIKTSSIIINNNNNLAHSATPTVHRHYLTFISLLSAMADAEPPADMSQEPKNYLGLDFSTQQVNLKGDYNWVPGWGGMEGEVIMMTNKGYLFVIMTF